MGKKIKKYNVKLNSETYAISMVERPAIEEDFVAFSKEDEEKVFFESDEKHIVYGAVLIPDKEIYRNNEKYGEYIVSFSNESVEKMSQDFMKNYRQYEVKTDHKNIANEVCVVESWLKSDLYKDKSVALGLNPNLPVGTWFCGMKVNNIDTWKRIKSGELKGFSVESALKLEEAFELNDNNMTINETNEMGFWNKMKEVLAEAFSKKEEAQTEPNEIESTNVELEEQTPSEPTPEPQPTVEEPKPQEAPTPEPQPQVAEEPVVEEKPTEPKVEDNHLEELIKNLQDEIKSLKEMNSGLQDKIKDLGKQPSAEPIKPNAKPNGGDNYSAWREQMAQLIR